MFMTHNLHAKLIQLGSRKNLLLFFVSTVVISFPNKGLGVQLAQLVALENKMRNNNSYNEEMSDLGRRKAFVLREKKLQ